MSRDNSDDHYDPTQCLNCGHATAASDKYCPGCSQRNRAPARSVGEWVGEVFSSFFHLDGKAWTSIRDLFIPGRYARNYIAGQRQRYIHPLRLLLFSSLVFFAVVSLERREFITLAYNDSTQPKEATPQSNRGFVHIVNDGTSRATLAHRAIDSLKRGLDSARLEARASGAQRQIREVESLLNQLGQAEKTLTDVRDMATEGGVLTQMRFIDVLRMDIVSHDRVRRLRDTLLASGYATDPAALAVLDTFARVFAMPDRWIPTDGATSSNRTLFYDEHVDVPVRLVAASTPGEVVAASGLEHWENRVVIRKAVALIQNGMNSFGDYLWSSLSWAVLLYVPFLALGYRLFYWRRMPYYAHSLMYSAILMTVALLSAALGILLFPWSAVPAVLIGVGALVYLVLGEAVVYDVPIWKVAVKQLALGFYGLVAFSFALVLWFGVALIFA